MVVTDNAANMKHAFELMTEPEDVVDASAGDSDDVSEGNLEQCWKTNQLKIEGWLGCSAHQLQLVVNEGYAELKSYHLTD